MYYSGFVFGPGNMYAVGKQSISMKDPLLTYALFVPMLGLFSIVGFTNLMRQTFLSYAKFISAPEEIARAMLANSALALSDRPFYDGAFF